ncbi:MAG: peptidylprolyl isomerase, partial [Bacteroidales bacterium]|nr:peptidylprolyl isomerase [Bacteroidales bacterium]
AKDQPAGRNRGAVKGNGGDLGYFTAFYMVYAFESAAYNTAVGEVSMPIRTQFGYHIIKVYDKIPELGKIEVKHINVKPNANDKKSFAAAENKIIEIAAEIKSGKKTFEEAAMQYSDDKGSAAKGGLLPAFEVSRMVPEFISAISKLKVDGISEPVKTQYGWHLIKLVRTIKIPEYDKYLPTLKTKVARDSRSNRSKEAAITKFKEEFKFKEYSKNLESFYSVIDSSIYANKWSSDKAEGFTKTIFKLEKNKYTQQDFAIYVEANQAMKHKGTFRYFVDKLYEKWVEQEVLKYKDSKLEEQYPEFRMLVQEYHDGILLFAISDEEIWGKAIKDTVGIEAFYDANKSNYMWKERVDATIYKCSSDSIAQFVKKSLADNIGMDSLIKLANKNSALNLHYENNKYESGSNDIIAQIKQEKGVSNIISVGNTFYVVDIKEIIPATNKELNEARGIITADYQNELEKNWIKKLNEDHKVVINKELLENK